MIFLSETDGFVDIAQQLVMALLRVMIKEQMVWQSLEKQYKHCLKYHQQCYGLYVFLRTHHVHLDLDCF